VGDLEVRGGVDGTWLGGVQLCIWQREGAASTRGAALVQQRQNVRVAADVAQVALDTPAQLHPAVASSTHEDDSMTSAAADVDRLHVAVVVRSRRRRLAWRQHSSRPDSGVSYNYDSTSIRPPFDSHSTAARPPRPFNLTAYQFCGAAALRPK